MTRKDFELIAATIRSIPSDSLVDRSTVARMFAKALESTNPRFDTERFVDAATKKENDK